MGKPVRLRLLVAGVLAVLLAAQAGAGDYPYTTDTTVDLDVVAQQWVPNNTVTVTDAALTVEYDGGAEYLMSRLTITGSGKAGSLIYNGAGTDALRFAGIDLTGASATNKAELQINGGTLEAVPGITVNLGDYSALKIAGPGTFTGGTVNLDGDDARIENQGTFTATNLLLDNAQASVRHTGKAFTVSGTAAITQGHMVLAANAAIASAGIGSSGKMSIQDATVTSSSGIAVEGVLEGTGQGGVTGTVGVSGGRFEVTSAKAGDKFTVASLQMSSGRTTIGSGAHLEATSLRFGGGTILVNNGGQLTATPAVDSGTTVPFSGLLDMNGGQVNLVGSAGFSSGGVHVSGTNNRVIFANPATEGLTIGGNARLDADQGSLTITGNLHLGAFSVGRGRDEYIYRVGYDSGTDTVNKVTVSGALSVDADSRVVVASSLLQKLESDPITNINILSAGSVLDINSFATTVRSTVYRYDVFLDTDGLYIGNFAYMTDGEIRSTLYDKWDRRLNRQARTVIQSDFAQAIIDGTKLYLGPNRDQLSNAGLFNAGVLYNLSDPDISGIGVDAVMLYNGSAVGTMSEAALSITRHVMTSLEDRNAYLRRMQVLIADTLASENSAAYGDCIRDDGFCPDRNADAISIPATRIWAVALGMRDKRKRDGVVSGFNYHGRGMTIGGDHIFGNLAVGGAFSYVGGDFTDGSSLRDSSSLDAYHFNIYGTYSHVSGFFLSGTLGYAWTDHRVDDKRFLPSGDIPSGALAGAYGQATADYQSSIWTGSLQAGYDFLPGEFLTVTPSVGVSFRRVSGDSHSEYFTSGNASANTLNVGKTTNTSLTLPVKLAFAYDLFGDEQSLMTLTGSVGYAYELKTDGAKGTLQYAGLNGIGPVRIVSGDRGRHAFTVGTGVRYMHRNFEFGLDYEYEGRKDFSSHSFSGTVGVLF